MSTKKGNGARPNGAPEIAITLDKVRHLRLDFNALTRVEEETGLNMLAGFNAGEITPKQFRGVVWALLAHEDDSLTPEKVGTYLHIGNMNDIATALAKVVNGGTKTENPKAESGG